MIFNTEDALAGLVKSIRSQVGYLLSTLQGSTLKAVVQDIQNGIRPDYPYIVVSIKDDDEQNNSWKRHEYIDDQDNSHILSEEELTFEVKCYGDSSVTILKTLRALALDDSLRSEMNTQVGATFIDYSGISRKPVFLSTDFINSATMIAKFTSVSDLVTTGGGVIERVIGEESYLQTNDDNDNISVSFDTNF